MSVDRRARSLWARLQRWRPELALVLAFAVIALVHLWWLHHFRRGLPLDTDEVGYFGFALDDLRGWHLGGLDGYFDTATSVTFAPLVPLTAAPVLGLFGHSPLVAMSVQLLFLAVLAGATYGVVSAMRDRRAGLLAGVLVLLVPGIFDFTRTFHFVIASSAFLGLAVCALVRSDRLHSRGWVIVFGAATGLMLISRTVMLSFLPGLGLAVIALLLRGGRERAGRRAVNLALGAAAGLAVAGWWYVPNLDAVIDYLTGLGYDSEYTAGHPSSPLDVEFWTARAGQIASIGLYLLPAVVLAIAIVWHLVRFVRRRPPLASKWLSVIAGPAGITAIVFVTSYVVLTTSPNPGTGFAVPLVPLVVMLGVHALAGLESRPRAVLASVLVASVGLVALGKTAVSGLGPLTSSRCLEVPTLGCVPAADGRANIMRTMERIGLDLTPPGAARRGEPGEWVRFSPRVATFLHDEVGLADRVVIVVFASRDPLFNTNSLQLAWRQLYDATLPLAQLSAQPGSEQVIAYAERLAASRYGQPELLFTADRGPEEYPPYVSQARVTRAARCLGFERARSFRLPDGRTARLYQRSVPLPPAETREELEGLLARCDARRQ